MRDGPNVCGPVLVVEDDDACRSLIGGLLRGAGFETAEAATGEAGLEALREARPALLVLDVCLPGICGYEICREARARFGSALPILFVSGERKEAHDRVAGLLLGADDYLGKPFAPDELLARARALLRRGGQKPSTNFGLTRRELEVLRLLARGRTQVEIARQLVVSSKTVATHIERILGKLGAHSRAEAVAVAYREQLVTAEP